MLPHSKITESSYRAIFCSEFNLSFHRPQKDQCDVCKTYQNSSSDEKQKLQTEYDRHMANKTKSRLEKNKDKEKYRKDQNTIVSCFDLEQILPTPHAFESTLYYKRKLNTFNFTIYNLCSSDGYCYVWNECIAKRRACGMASCLLKFIELKSLNGAKIFIFVQ